MVNNNVIDGQLTTSETNMSSTKKKNEKSGADLDVNDFLNLLVAQMKYQDPMEPSDNTQYIAQMATFTQVEATTDMGSRVEQQMASSLVGKNVIMLTNDNSSGMISGKVDYWEKIDGKIYLGIDKKLYDISDLDTVLDNEYYDKLDDSEA